MEGKTSLFDTTAIGAILVLSFAVSLLAVNPICFWTWIDQSKILVLESNNLLPKWVAIGVAMSVLGAIIQMVAICWFEARFEDSEARKNLKQRVKEWLETENRSAAVKKTLDVRECELILGAHPDSIFAWIHYSDPRKELIDWGRRKLHYVYLAENWMVSIVLGGGAGLGLGVVNMCFFPHEQVPAPWFSISFLGNLVGALGYISLVVIVLIGLQSLRKKNKQYDEDMITMYCSGRICHDLEERFLPTSIEKRDPIL